MTETFKKPPIPFDITTEISSNEFNTTISNPDSKLESSNFKSDDKELELIIYKIKFTSNEAILLRKLFRKLEITDNKIIFEILKWLQVWKYVKDNINKLANNNFIGCDLKENFIMNIFHEIMTLNKGLFFDLLKNWLEVYKKKVCTGDEVIRSPF